VVSIEVGKDGDVLIWDRFPLDVGAKPSHVIIEGNLELSLDIPTVPTSPDPTATLDRFGPTTCISPSPNNTVIQGVTVYTLNSEPLINATIVVGSDIRKDSTVDGAVTSTSSQIAQLRSYFNLALPGTTNELYVPFRAVDIARD